MSVCVQCYVLSGRELCDELITRPEKSYRLPFVVVCDLETSRMRRPWPELGRSAAEGKKRLRASHLLMQVTSIFIASVLMFCCRHFSKANFP
jgi:hypothetical protein